MNLKDKLAVYVFKNASRFKRAKREIVSISKAKSIGILYDASQVQQVTVIQKFVEKLKLQGKTVTLFGFYNKKKLPPDFNTSLNNEILTRSDLHWYGLPKKSAYALMANEPFDMLLNLCTWHCIPLLMVSAASKAKFRVGKYFTDSISCFDFMLKVEQNTPVEKFLTQIEEFSTKFKV